MNEPLKKLKSQESSRCFYCDKPIKDRNFSWCWGELTYDDDDKEVLVIRHICKECGHNGREPPKQDDPLAQGSYLSAKWNWK